MSSIQRINNHIWQATVQVTETVPYHLYLLSGSSYAVWIDSGTPDMVDLLFQAMDTAKVSTEDLQLILNTHPHPTHIGANGVLKARTNCLIAAHPLYASWHRNRAAHLSELEKIFPAIVEDHSEWRDEIFHRLGSPHSVDILIDEGVRFQLGGPELETFRFSGHMDAQLAWLDHETSTLFLGDAITVMEAPFMHGHTNVAGYRKTLSRIDTLLDEKEIDLVLLSHFPPLDRAETRLLIGNAKNYLDRLDTIIQNLITGHEEIGLRELWKAVCETMSRQLDHRSLRTVFAHVEGLIEEDKVREVEKRVYQSRA